MSIQIWMSIIFKGYIMGECRQWKDAQIKKETEVIDKV